MTPPTSRRARPRAAAIAALVLAAVIGSLLDPVVAPRLAAATPAAPSVPPSVDPGAPGPQAIDELEYDLGDQAVKPTGFPAKVELKAKVYAPQTIAGRAPLVVLQHGRHTTCATASTTLMVWPCPPEVPEVPSYRGYDALGRTLASHGMVVVSIGANGINANDGFLDDGGASARAQLILEHLRRWEAWDASADGSPFGDRFVGHIDLDRVGLMGHSRGGEGIAAAVQLNQRIGSPFGIVAALALAPVDFGRRVLGGVQLEVVLPYCDGDVSDLQGASYYDDGRYASPGDPTSKATVLLAGANHNFFNTVWTTGPGSFDDADFLGAGPRASATDPCQAGGPGRLTAAQQAQAGATLMAGFFRRHLGPEPALQGFVTGTGPYPPSSGPARWSIAYHAPERLDVESWASPSTARLNAFDQIADVRGAVSGLVCNPKARDGLGGPIDVDVASTPCRTSPDRDSAIVNDTGVLDVGWVRQGPVVRELLAPGGVDVSGFDGLRMRVAVLDDDRNTARAKQDFSVVLEDFDGARTSVAASTGTNGLQRIGASAVRHAVLNGIRLPLAAFSTIDLTRVKAVELRFDRTGGGRLAVADLAFTQEGTGAAAATVTGPPVVAPPQPACRRTAANRWACALVALLWGRQPAPEELGAIAKGYPTADARRRTIALMVASPEAATLHHDQFVQSFTQGEIDPEWVSSVLSDAGRRSWEAATADLAGGFAFSSPSLATPTDNVQAAYQTILGRSADPSGLAYWAPKLERGASAMAASLVRTSTARGRIVDERYQQILGRTPDPAGRSYWVGRLAAAGGEQSLVASLLGTESFRVAATH